MLDKIKLLQLICEDRDQIQLKLNWDLLENQREEDQMFMYYEQDQLVGFLGIYDFGNKIELCGMVHPEFRRKGIFTQLANKAFDLCKKKKGKTILLNAPANSITAKQFLANIPCSYTQKELQMQWMETTLYPDENVVVRPALDDDDELQIQLDVDCFQFPYADAEQFHHRLKADPNHHFYMIEYDGKTIGKIRVFHDRKDAWIYSFAITPSMQGKGIGKKALSNVVLNEANHGYRVFLEVDSTNTNAMKLYETCGFKTIQAQDYYEYKMELLHH
jgi:ribosomal protein S18 acetylase RimI-like enzyme